MKRAIDIVLIPSDDIISACLAVNKVAYDQGYAPTLLSHKDRVPHISLLMGVLDDDRIPTLKKNFHDIAVQTASMVLRIIGEKPSWLFIEKTPELVTLHERLITEIDPLLTHDPSEDMFFAPEKEAIAEDVYPWITHFVTQYSRENFQPHITTFSRDPYPEPFPVSFSTQRLAVYQLGNYNTCRNLLIEKHLQ